jgi:holo-[acyl-carrier protein] synthase
MGWQPYGIGIDLVEVGRIRDLLNKHGKKFKLKTFTQHEIEYCDSKSKPEIHYAARFAAKEAAAKALGTGIWRHGVDWLDFEVYREDFEKKPELRVSGGALKEINIRGVGRWFLSLSHTEMSAIAQVSLYLQE